MKRAILALAAFAAYAPTAVGEARADYFILVFDAPADFVAQATQLGFVDIQDANLSAIGFNGYRVKLPAGTSLDTAIQSLKKRFPNAAVDSDAALAIEN